jgi:amino acid transporter
MNATSRDEGLVRKVGPWGLAASIVSIVVGAGIFAVPGALAKAVGPYAPLAFLACGLAIGAVAICFAEGGSRMPTSGGVYGYIESAFGPLTACCSRLHGTDCSLGRCGYWEWFIPVRRFRMLLF